MATWQAYTSEGVSWWTIDGDGAMLVINKREPDSRLHDSDKFWLWSHGMCVCGPFETLEAAKAGYILVAPNYPMEV